MEQKDFDEMTKGDQKALFEDFIDHMEKLGPKLCELFLTSIAEYQKQGRPVFNDMAASGLALVIWKVIEHIDKKAHPGVKVNFLTAFATILDPVDAKVFFAGLPEETRVEILDRIAEALIEQRGGEWERMSRDERVRRQDKWARRQEELAGPDEKDWVTLSHHGITKSRED